MMTLAMSSCNQQQTLPDEEFYVYVDGERLVGMFKANDFDYYYKDVDGKDMLCYTTYETMKNEYKCFIADNIVLEPI